MTISDLKLNESVQELDIEDFHKFVHNPLHLRHRNGFMDFEKEYTNIYEFFDSLINVFNTTVLNDTNKLNNLNKQKFNNIINKTLLEFKLP